MTWVSICCSAPVKSTPLETGMTTYWRACMACGRPGDPVDGDMLAERIGRERAALLAELSAPALPGGAPLEPLAPNSGGSGVCEVEP